MSRRVMFVVCLVAAAGLGLSACSSDDEGDGATGGSAGGGGSTVEITLQEFAVIPGAASAPAGSITFEATNNGPDDDHELVVIQTDLAPDALPTNDNGSVNEEGEGVTAIDEIPEFAPGETQSLTVDLEAGNYVLICNVFDESEQESHYQQGMRVSFTVV